MSVLTRIFGVARGEVDATVVDSLRARPSGISLSSDVSGKFGLMISCLQAEQNYFVACFVFFGLVSRTTKSTVVTEVSWQKQAEAFVSPETMWGQVGGGFVPKRGACPPLIISDDIDHLALTYGFTYLNNQKYSLTSLALAMLACLPSLFVNAVVCSRGTAEKRTTKQANKAKKK